MSEVVPSHRRPRYSAGDWAGKGAARLYWASCDGREKRTGPELDQEISAVELVVADLVVAADAVVNAVVADAVWFVVVVCAGHQEESLDCEVW